jgi:hypothetical protein
VADRMKFNRSFQALDQTTRGGTMAAPCRRLVVTIP